MDDVSGSGSQAACWAFLPAVAAAAGCGADDEPREGGNCTTTDGCFQVSDPPKYDVAAECSWVNGSWPQRECDPAPYARKCTQVSQISINDGLKRDVTYVYLWPADSNFTCLGTEELL